MNRINLIWSTKGFSKFHQDFYINHLVYEIRVVFALMTASISLKLGDANLIKKDTNYEKEKTVVIIDNVSQKSLSFARTLLHFKAVFRWESCLITPAKFNCWLFKNAKQETSGLWYYVQIYWRLIVNKEYTFIKDILQ